MANLARCIARLEHGPCSSFIPCTEKILEEGNACRTCTLERTIRTAHAELEANWKRALILKQEVFEAQICLCAHGDESVPTKMIEGWFNSLNEKARAITGTIKEFNIAREGE